MSRRLRGNALLAAKSTLENEVAVVCALQIVADREQMAGVLRVDLAIRAERGRRVGRAQRQLLEDFLAQSASVIDGKQVAIFAVGIDQALRINRKLVDAPLEA